mmetsp:Transcript_27183/g.56607  ORF Transcript_27183/g.56607 Transcript_27183/m.56607 type:complete len:610 (-) Transcript_27183:410-2239(-)
MTASDDDSALNRRPSELNAATDLVGLRAPNTVEDELVKQPLNLPEGDGDIIKKSIKVESSDAKIQPVKIEPKQEPPQTGPAQSAVLTPPAPGPAVPQEVSAPKPRNASHDTEAVQYAATDDNDAEKTAFPILLHEIVTDPATDECIHWLACGTRFMISDKKKFAKDVLPRFYGHAKFTSFTRRLKRWSFTRVPSGPSMGAYYNPNFRKGEAELAARVRYDHPTPLSGAAMQLNKAKLQAVGSVALGMGGMGPGGFVNPMMAQMALSNEDREVLMRQMNMMNGGGMMQGAMPQAGVAGGNPNLESLYRAMSQNAGAQQQPNNLAATNNSVALQMAMAQEMMQQRQAQMGAASGMTNFTMDQARLLAQQQMQQQQQQRNNPNQMAILNAASGFNLAGAAAVAGQQQVQAGQGPEDQRLMAAMFLDRLNKQNQQPQQPNANMQQQQQNQQQGTGGNFQGSSMPSLASLTPSSSIMSSHPSGLSNFNFAGQTQNTSDGSLPNNQQAQSTASLNTLTGGRASSTGVAAANNSGTQPLQLNYPNANMGAGAAAAAAAAGGIGGAPTNPTAVNALLADYLRRTSNAGGTPAGGNVADGVGNQEDGKNGESKTEASC